MQLSGPSELYAKREVRGIAFAVDALVVGISRAVPYQLIASNRKVGYP
jgi:hypothetical protein